MNESCNLPYPKKTRKIADNYLILDALRLDTVSHVYKFRMNNKLEQNRRIFIFDKIFLFIPFTNFGCLIYFISI